MLAIFESGDAIEIAAIGSEGCHRQQSWTASTVVVRQDYRANAALRIACGARR
jgi:hypothetical protein